MEQNALELVVVVVNDGFSSSVINYAKEICDVDATLIKGRSATVNKDGETKQSVYGEKEIVLFAVNKEDRSNLIENICAHIGLGTNAQAMAFSLPIEDWSMNCFIPSEEEVSTQNEEQLEVDKVEDKEIKEKDEIDE